MKTKAIGLFCALALAGAAWAFLSNNSVTINAPSPAPVVATKASSAEAEQILELTAKDGYSPSVIEAKAGVPILLKVKTQDTQDCSTAFTIPSFGIQAGLPATGVTEFNLPAQKSGETIEGSCQMGMSHFVIEFK